MTDKQTNIFLFLCALTTTLIFFLFNKEIFLALNGAGDSPLWNLSWGLLTQFGDGFVVSLLTVLLIRKYPSLTAKALLALLFSLIFSQGGKEIFGGPRPLSYFGEQVVNTIGPKLGRRSFPSGHSATIFLFCWLLWKNRVLPQIGFAWILAGALIAISRIAVGAHFPVDVAGGAWLGVLAAWLGSEITGKFPKYSGFLGNPKLQIFFYSATIVSIPFMFINFHPAKYFPEFYIAFAFMVFFTAGYYLREIWKNGKMANLEKNG